MRMPALGVVLIVPAACGGDHAPAPTAPIAVDVAPAAPITSGPLAQSPPPDPTPPERERVRPDEGEPRTAPAPVVAPGAPTAPFDRGAAAAALSGAPIKQCLLPGDPSGPGHVSVTWDPSGRVASATIDQGPFAGTPVGACLARVYSTATIPPFFGAPVRVGKGFVLQ